MPASTTLRPEDVIRRIGDTNDKAIEYVLSPDPQLTRISRKVRESLITEIPPVTAGALLGPAALARHFVASAASGRYRDLFSLWRLFRERPDECKSVLAERPQAVAKARQALLTALRLGLLGHADRVAEDIALAEGLIWQWLREGLTAETAIIAQRPAVASALLVREPDLDLQLPNEPDERWLAEAAQARMSGPLAPAVDKVLAANAGRLPATVATLSLAHSHYPGHVEEIVDRIDLHGRDIGPLLAWARDHGQGPRVQARVGQEVAEVAERDRAEALSRWWEWRERGVELPLPDSVKQPSLDGLDLSRPETAQLAALLLAEGVDLRPQSALEDLSRENRQRAEKAYEAFVCAGLDVTLPAALEGNPIVKEGTRCPHCAAWTWVRPGHEKRCPRAAGTPVGA